MEKKYKESLDLFEEIYFGEKGIFNYKFKLFSRDYNERYEKMGKDYRDGDNRSKIIGKSAFTPKIIAGDWDEELRGYRRLFLTLDEQGKFDHHFYMESVFQKKGGLLKIDVTDMSREEIMAKVEQMLNMSNEEIMSMFNVGSTNTPSIKIGLIIDDVIAKYYEQQGKEFKQFYGPEWGMEIRTEQERINLSGVNDREPYIYINKSDESSRTNNEEIRYEILTKGESDLDKIEIKITEADVNSELGKLILRTLEERFTERQIEEEKVEPKFEEEEKTGAEKIIEFMKQNNLEAHDLALALSMSLARNRDKTNAEQHLVNSVNKDRESLENIK